MAEIPGQLLSYMTRRGIRPNPAMAAPDGGSWVMNPGPSGPRNNHGMASVIAQPVVPSAVPAIIPVAEPVQATVSSGPFSSSMGVAVVHGTRPGLAPNLSIQNLNLSVAPGRTPGLTSSLSTGNLIQVIIVCNLSRSFAINCSYTSL